MDAFTAASAAAILDANFAPWVKDLRLTIASVGADRAKLRMPFGDRLTRVGGTVCGQALMTLADTTMVFAIAAASGGFRPMTTVNQTISFMRPITASAVIAEGRVIRLGKTLAFGEVLLSAEGSDAVAAHATSTYAILGPVGG
ncbi:MAG: PaaI family thioesterase [Proteobacteria bacterium]|nr:PaaI family thioesterase [Pseudomonadota bacterium]